MNSNKITQRLHAAYAHYASNPVSRYDLASYVGPHGSLRYGYAAINRALRAGVLLRVSPPDGVTSRGMWVQYTGCEA